MTAAGLRAELTGAVGAFRVEARFEAPPGRVTSVFGPSGAGKTTLLRALAGLTRLQGRLEVRGEVWQDDARRVFVAPHRRGAGFCFQEPALFPHLSVRHNLDYGRRRAPAPPPGAPAFDETVERLGLGSLLDRAPAGLSGGELQRAALARAILANPRILLLDEPLSGVHWSARSGILAWLRSLAEDLGLVVLQVSHDLDEVIRVAHRIALIADGRVAEAAPAGDVLAAMGHGDRVSWLEAGAVLTARVAARPAADGLTELELHGQAMRVPGLDRPAGAEVRLRVRSRDVAIATERPRHISIRNVLAGEVREVREEVGTPFVEVLVDVGPAGSPALLRARITRAAATELGLGPGRAVYALLKTVSFDEPR